LTQQDSVEAEADGEPGRFQVELFIVHPTFAPADISAALGLEAGHALRVGDPRKTPKGTPLSGNYRDMRWRYSVEYSAKEQWYAAEVTRFVDRLEPHKAFFAKLRSTGGTVCVIVQFFSSAHFADEIPLPTLAKLVDLELSLAIETY
jgi:hypothetical protein